MFYITSFYRFIEFSTVRLMALQDSIYEFAHDFSINGLVLLAPEGINLTVAGEPQVIEKFKTFLENQPGFDQPQFKDSQSEFQPFRRMRVEIRREIITTDGKFPRGYSASNQLNPEEWESMLNDPSIEKVVLDTRNHYEVRLGSFKDALDPKLERFSDLEALLISAQIPKEKAVMMYCTGGIRCEKAATLFNAHGYKNVYQLQGGILKYLEHFPHSQFEGECFVFDHRVAVDQELKPSKLYKLCPHCGNPGTKRIDCLVCERSVVVCDSCSNSPSKNTCSKNCSHSKPKNSS